MCLLGKSSHDKTHAIPTVAVDIERLIQSDDLTLPVLTVTVKFAFPPLVRVRDAGFGVQIAFAGT